MSAVEEMSLSDGSGAPARAAKPGRGLLGKYTATLVSLVVFVLAINAMVETWIIYGQTVSRLQGVQAERAASIARRLTDLVNDVERQVSWATRASSDTLERRRADYTLLLSEVPAVSELAYVDGTGALQLDVAQPGGASPRNGTAGLADALGHAVWFGPTYFVGDDPYLMLGVAHAGAKGGSTVAWVSLRSLSALVDPDLKDTGGYGYVVGPSGRVVAASETSGLRPGDTVGALPQVGDLAGKSHPPGTIGRNPAGVSVIAAAEAVEGLGWTVIVEQPTWNVHQPIFDLLTRLAWLLALGLAVAVLAGLVLARRMTRPIDALRLGAAQFAAHRFEHRIAIGTRDELDELGQQLNQMADELAASYGQLEMKVAERTRDLGQSVRELETLEQIGRAIASSLDLKTVLAVIVTRIVALAKADAGAIFTYDAASRTYLLAEARGLPAPLVASASHIPIAAGEGWSEDDFGADGLIRVPDLKAMGRFPLQQAALDAGFRSVLVMALRGPAQKLGVLVMYRRSLGEVLTTSIGVMQTLADQSVSAMNNARLFREVMDKGEQIEIANGHRTLFFANMSHELRTPLNAVLGYTELLYDGLYGAMPERARGVLERVQSNGKHLLGLINDVLDLTKMEAGSLQLALAPYSMPDLVAAVVAATEPLARAKGLALETEVAPDLPLGHGDERRLTQVLLNLVGNAIKFTDKGSVTIGVALKDQVFALFVRDTGLGIPADDLHRIFEDFQQVEGVEGHKTAGTGLGLSISRRLVAMHGGTIAVASVPGEGSTFTATVPVHVNHQRPVP